MSDKLKRYKALLRLWTLLRLWKYNRKSKLYMDIYQELERMWNDFSEADLDEWEAGYA